MRSTFTNQFGTRYTVARALETVVAIGTAMLASAFILAAVLPPVGHALIG